MELLCNTCLSNDNSSVQIFARPSIKDYFNSTSDPNSLSSGSASPIGDILGRRIERSSAEHVKNHNVRVTVLPNVISDPNSLSSGRAISGSDILIQRIERSSAEEVGNHNAQVTVLPKRQEEYGQQTIKAGTSMGEDFGMAT